MAQKHLARQAGKFVKHVLPAAVKPVHSLWHEVLAFIFLFIAVSSSWYVYRRGATLGPMRIAIVLPIIVVAIFYGVSSFLKARRISRS